MTEVYTERDHCRFVLSYAKYNMVSVNLYIKISSFQTYVYFYFIYFASSASHSLISPFQIGRGKNRIKKLMGLDKNREN